MKPFYEARLDAGRLEDPDVATAAATASREVAELRSALAAAMEAHAAQLDVARSDLELARAEEQRLQAALERRRGELAAAERRASDAELTRDVELERMQAAIDAEFEAAAAVRAQLAGAADELAAARWAMRRVNESVTWQAVQRLRTPLYRRLGGERSRKARAFKFVMHAVGSLPFLRPAREAAEAPAAASAEEARSEATPLVAFPRFSQPTVSVIVPLHTGVELTRTCLESIRDNTAGVAYEVVVVDDEADAETKLFLERVQGATVVVNERNLGYLRSVNRAAGAARGRWLVLANNDIVVRPGWLRALLACAESAADVGAVTPKYLYPDGTLNEAGAITWRDGSGVNYGRGDDPSRPAYNYRRQVDYGSAAALLVRAELFAGLGGYDERFAPMYYEDADLCFRLRQGGARVLYEPEAVVVHVEGGTAGTDPGSGHKRHQERSRVTFVSKWFGTLDSAHLSAHGTSHRRGADRLAGRHVLVIDHRVPMWDRDAGSVRMVGILRALQQLGFQVTFLPDNFDPAQPYTAALQRMGTEVLYGPLDLHAELTARGPTFAAALLSRPVVAARWLTAVRDYSPAAKVIYDTVDLHWVRETRGREVGGTSSATAAKVRALRELELAMVRASDATLVVTDVERRTLEAEVPGAEIRVVPMLHEVADSVAPLAGRSGIVFLGSFAHPPNADAARQLVEVIMPEVWRRLPDTPVRIVGEAPPPDVMALAQPLVEVTGWVEDLEALLSSTRLMVAPLRFGAGMKGKVTQSLALGLPVVTTAIGAEGLETGADSGLLLAEEPEDFAARIVAAYTDDAFWWHLSRSGQAAMMRTCSPAVACEVFDRLLRRQDAFAAGGSVLAGAGPA